MLCKTRKRPTQLRAGGKDKFVRKLVAVVSGLWITGPWAALALDIHKQHGNDQLLKTLSKELKSRVNSLLVDLSIAILRQACSTVV